MAPPLPFIEFSSNFELVIVIILFFFKWRHPQLNLLLFILL